MDLWSDGAMENFYHNFGENITILDCEKDHPVISYQNNKLKSGVV